MRDHLSFLRLMANLRAQISRDELEMTQLSNRQREAKQLREHNGRQRRELGQLEAEYAHGEGSDRRENGGREGGTG